MIFDENRLTIPSNDEYSVAQLRMMIQEVEEIIDRASFICVHLRTLREGFAYICG
ncbi:MAG: hypothetical protein RLZZ338_3207 [Cyanobacteriota bacterium]|jgi:hypothetical protein